MLIRLCGTDAKCSDNLDAQMTRQYTPLTGWVLSISVNSFQREYSCQK